MLFPSNDFFDRIKQIKEEDNKKIGFDDDKFIFGFDEPISRSTIDRYRRKWCSDAGIKYTTNHQFRHYGISRMVYEKVDLSAIADFAGHNKNIMLGIYTQTLKEANKDLVDTIERVYVPKYR